MRLPRGIGASIAEEGRDLAPAASRETEQVALMAAEDFKADGGMALLVGKVRAGDDLAEVRVAGEVLRQQDDVVAALHRHLSADDRLDPGLPGVVVESDRAVEAVVIRDGKRIAADLPGPIDQRLDRVPSVQERKVRMYMQVSKRHFKPQMNANERR